MTEDERLDNLIRQTLDESRRPPEPPMDAMWANIERRAFDVSPVRRIPYAGEWRWRAPALAAAAALIIGAGLGWSLAPRQVITHVVSVPTQMSVLEPPDNASRSASVTPATAPGVVTSEPSAAVRHPVNSGVTVSQHGSDASMSRLASQFDEVGSGSDMGRYLAQTSALLASLPSDRASSVSDTAIATRASDLLTQTHLLLDSRAGSDPTLHRLLEDLELVLAQVARLRVERNGTDLQMIHQAITVHDVLPRVHDASLEASITD